MSKRINNEDYSYNGVKKYRGRSKKPIDNSNISRERNNKNLSKVRDAKVQPDDFESPLEDMEILRAMGMDRCMDCNNLYPLHLNRCPNCNID
jgi:hypothetical protein